MKCFRLCLVGCVLAGACGRAPTPPLARVGGPQPLVLVGEPDPSLTVLRFEITSGTCGYGPGGPKLADVSVDESAESVTVTASLEAPKEQPEGVVCSDIGVVVPVTVALERLLGTRAILDGSCTPPAPVVRKGSDAAPCAPARQDATPANAVGTWTAIDAGPLATRGEPRGAWTGRELIVLGGLAVERSAAFDDGAAYDPGQNRWRRIARRPEPGRIFAPAWTGKELIVLGVPSGLGLGGIRGGHAYDPQADRWRAIAPAPIEMQAPVAWWTGREVLFWQFGSGALYDPASDRWRTIPAIDVPGAMAPNRAMWLGSVLAVQGAANPEQGGGLVDALYLFDPSTNTWRASAPPPAVPQWGMLSGVWSGSEEIFFSPGDGGGGVCVAYDPKADTWRKLPAPDVSIDGGTGYFLGVAIGDGRVVVRVADSRRPLHLFDSKSGRWSYAAAPDGPIPGPDGVLAWTGSDVVLWGRPAIARPNLPNAAWRWTPPRA